MVHHVAIISKQLLLSRKKLFYVKCGYPKTLLHTQATAKSFDIVSAQELKLKMLDFLF